MEKSKKKKIILAGIGTAAASILGYFGWQYFKNKKEENASKGNASESGSDNTEESKSNPPSDSPHHSSSSYGGGSGFPLRKGSRGSKVKALQLALMNKYGSSILPKYGADGDFGSETTKALQSKGLPTEIDQSTYDSIVNGTGSGGGSGNAGNATQAGDTLYNAVENNDFNAALAALKQLNTTTDYSLASNQFETHTIGFVRKTLVNGLFDQFTDDNQKQQIKQEFLRMGLQYNGSKWTLSGLPGYRIITTSTTKVYEKGGMGIPVGRNVVLGHIEGVRGEWAYFYPANAQVLLRVKKDSIKPFKQ